MVKRPERTGRIIVYLATVVACILCIGFLARFTGGFTSDVKTFYVTVNDRDVMTTSGGYVLTPNEPLSVEVKYTFAFDAEEVQGYSVKVVPNKLANQDFDFTLNGEVYSFQAEKDFTAGFDIEYGATSFSIRSKGTLTDTLQAVYPHYVVGNYDDKTYKDMFTLVVASYNQEASVSLTFTVASKPTGVTLDREVITF